MHPDLERVITLQRLDSAAQDAQRRLADEPERAKALDARLAGAHQRLTTAKERLAANQNARRAIEKDVAVHQARLSKFRDQAMAVKTNQEYHAVQKEIGFAQTEIKALEDRILELRASLARITAERAEIVAAIDPQVLKIFELISRRGNGVAVAEARDGICTICHVRLRPQVFNTVRGNEAITQCDSCQRILYFVPASFPATPDKVT